MTDANKNKRVEFSPLFLKNLQSAPTDIKHAFAEALELFKIDTNHPALRNHALTDTYAGMRSIDITADWRAVYRSEAERFVFMDIGTHEKLYR